MITIDKYQYDNIFEYVRHISSVLNKLDEISYAQGFRMNLNYDNFELTKDQVKYIKDKWSSDKNKIVCMAWYVAYTNIGSLKICYYNDLYLRWEGEKYDSEKEVNGKKIQPLYWTPIIFDKLEGTEIDGVKYIGFPKERISEDSVRLFMEIKPNDVCNFRLKKAQQIAYMGERYPLNRYTIMSYEKFLKSGLTLNDVASVEFNKPEESESSMNCFKFNYLEDSESEYKSMDPYDAEEYNISRFESMKDMTSKMCEIKNMSTLDTMDYMAALEVVTLKRRTGKTRKIICQIIADFYDLPKGTPILVRDHSKSSIEEQVAFVKRVDKIISHLGYRYILDKDSKIDPNNYYLKRLSMTEYEKAHDTINKLTKKYGLR